MVTEGAGLIPGLGGALLQRRLGEAARLGPTKMGCGRCIRVRFWIPTGRGLSLRKPGSSPQWAGLGCGMGRAFATGL